MHFILILTPYSLERTQDPNDWLRREIEYAIKTKRNIIPLTFDGFEFEDIQRYLPSEVSNTLKKYNALRVPVDYFDAAMQSLRERFLSVSIEMTNENAQINEIIKKIMPQGSFSSGTTRPLIDILVEGIYFVLEYEDTRQAIDKFKTALLLDDDLNNSFEQFRAKTGKRKHIFLSYSRNNNTEMLLVKSTLNKENFLTWTDENLKPGTPQWQKEIENAINLSKGLVVLLSPTAKSSEWVGREINYARQQGVPIFPTLIEGDEKDAIPFTLAGSQWIDLRQKFLSGMMDLISELNARLLK